jgi:hypothetical protein
MHTVGRLQFTAATPINRTVRQIAGVNLDEMLRAAVGGKLDLSEPLVNYETGTGDLVQIWLEQ